MRIGPGGESAAIRVLNDAPLVQLVAEQLADFVELRTGNRPQIDQGGPNETDRGIVFMLGREVEPALRATVNQPAGALPDMREYRDDGYAIRTLPREGATYIICAGKGDSGIKYAVYRLMRATTTQHRTIQIPPLSVQANPFFRGRYATPSSAMAGGAPLLLQKHYAWENWHLSRIPALVDYFDAIGMNGLFLFDSPCRYNWTGNLTPPEEMAVKIRAMARRARELNLLVCLWAHATSNLAANSLSELQPRDPEQLKQILADYDRLAERYGDLIDALYAHWVDPGGAPPPADITDPQKLQMELLARLEKKAGRKLFNIFSAHGLHWPMGPGGSLPWAGYKGPETLIESGILPQGTCIATPEMRIYPGQIEFARKVRAGGYTCGIFGWLIAEYEMNPGIHVHTHIMERYFHGIPEECCDLFDWYEEGLVYHTLNLATYYVFAQMLWDPRSSPDAHLSDFCLSAFGPLLGPKMVEGYQAIAEVRCGSASPEDRGGCRLGRGSDDPARDLKICEEAVAELEGAYADLSYLPTIPLPVSAETMINDLRAQLTGMATYARFRLESPRVGSVIANGGSQAQIREAIAAMPKLELWPGTSQPKTPGSWGQPEYWPYADIVNRWEQQLQTMAAGKLPDADGPVLFADDFTNYPEGADGRPSWQPTTDNVEDLSRPQWMTERGTMSVSIPGDVEKTAAVTGLLLAGGADWNKTKDWKNYSVQARLKLIRQGTPGSSVGLRVRIVGSDAPQSQNGYAIRMRSDLLEFGWLSAGHFKPLQSAPLTGEPGRWHTIRVDCRDFYYKAYFDGRLLLGAEDWYGPRSGRIALEIRGAHAAFDDVTIRQIE